MSHHLWCCCEECLLIAAKAHDKRKLGCWIWVLAALLFIALLAVHAHAQSTEVKPKFFTNSRIVDLTAITASMVADVETTHVIIMQGGWEGGGAQSFLGLHPSRARMYAVWSGIDGGEYGLAVFAGNRIRKAGHPKLARIIEHGIAAQIAIGHLRAAAHNQGVLR